jgi:hypothetical protein
VLQCPHHEGARSWQNREVKPHESALVAPATMLFFGIFAFVGGVDQLVNASGDSDLHPGYLVAGGVVLLALCVVYGRRALAMVRAARAGSEPIGGPPAVGGAPGDPGGPSPLSASPSPPASVRRVPHRRRGNVLDRGDEFNFPLLLGAVPLAILGIGIHDAVSGELSTSDLVTMAAIGTVFLIAFVWTLVQQRAEDRFTASLQHCRTTGAPLVHRGREIDRDAEIVVFDVAASLVVITFRYGSRPLVVGVDRIGPTRTMCLAITLLLGWWGLPAGPIFAILAIVSTAQGGRRCRVRDAIENPGWAGHPATD